MAEGSAVALCRGHATICLPIGKDEYDAIVENPKGFRRWLDGCFAEMPELFPQVAILRCFLHGWLKIRDRAKHLGDLFFDIGHGWKLEVSHVCLFERLVSYMCWLIVCSVYVFISFNFLDFIL